MNRLAPLLVLALTMVAAAQLAQPPVLLAESSDAAALADARRFRQAVGFRSDDAYLQAAEADDSLDRSYGLPLTPAEVVEMSRRERIQDGIGPIIAYLEGHPDEYGGIYLDQLDGASINVGWRGDAICFGCFAAESAARRHSSRHNGKSLDAGTPRVEGPDLG